MRKTSLSFIDSFERNIEEQIFFCLRLFYLEITWAKPQVSYPMTSPDYRTLSSGVLLVRRSSLILALLHNIVSNYSSEPGRVGCACFWLRQKWLFSYEHCYWLGLFKVCFWCLWVLIHAILLSCNSGFVLLKGYKLFQYFHIYLGNCLCQYCVF